jgi:hypothetical protein
MDFLLIGFKEGSGVRHFRFECVAPDHSRRTVVVHADTALARKHEIRMQELPLLCLRLLQSINEGEVADAVTFTEDHMITIQTAARAAAEKKPKPPRRPSPAMGQAWRNLQL